MPTSKDGVPQAESTVVFPLYASFPVPRNCPGTLKGNTWSIRMKSSSRIWWVKIPGDSQDEKGSRKGHLFSLPWRVLPAHQQILRVGIEKNTTHPTIGATAGIYHVPDTVQNVFETVQIILSITLWGPIIVPILQMMELRLAKWLAKVPELEITSRWYLNAAFP